MRSLWLASAATICIAGAAFAQTSGPAPTGAPNAATMTAPGQSPGNTGTNTPSTSVAGSSSMSSGGPANGGSGPADKPVVTAPGASAGKTMSAGTTSMNNDMDKPMSSNSMSSKPMMTSSTTMHHHYMHSGMGYMHSGMGMGGMPANASTSTYLTIAKHSMMHHNKAMADEALSRAETNELDRSVPQGEIAPSTDPSVTSIESARKALMAGDMHTAMSDTNMAMQQSGGMSSMGNGGMGNGGMTSSSSTMGSGGMGNDGMNHGSTVMPNARVSSDMSGGAPAAGATSDSAATGGANAAAMGHSTVKPASSP